MEDGDIVCARRRGRQASFIALRMDLRQQAFAGAAPRKPFRWCTLLQRCQGCSLLGHDCLEPPAREEKHRRSVCFLKKYGTQGLVS